MDERFIMHRYKATRAAMVAGILVIAAFFTYGYLAEDMIRWDLLLVMTAMAVVKVAAMLYYRKTN